ncbi:hypothetical protein LXL04_007945 [Taraxacum kok-saghyz]
MAFICGSVNSQEEDDYDVLWPYPSTSPRKPTRSRRTKNIINRYSDRGLDKFEALLADLDHRRQKIFTQKGSEDVSMVKFVYRSPDDVKPIVVKLRDHRKHQNTSSLQTTPELEHQKDVAFVEGNDGDDFEKGKRLKPLMGESKKKFRFNQWRRKLGEDWKPSYYIPLFVMLVLVLLTFTGRCFAILCTSLGWYFVPIINDPLHNSKQWTTITKNEYIKKARPIDKQSRA